MIWRDERIPTDVSHRFLAVDDQGNFYVLN